MPPSASPHRPDIQVLRAIAVLAVLGFHYQLPGLARGHLGVDVFFVISGYLMSRLVMADMDAGRFRMGAFMLRRARRLLPAALTMMAATALLAPWVLAPAALRDFAWQLGGALGMGANIVLWQQSGYFSGAAELKLLLHMWSLSVEEQFYLVLPWVLMATGVRGRKAVLLGLTAASLALCVWLLGHAPDTAFYLLPSRAWELLLGALCALPWRRPAGVGNTAGAPAQIKLAWFDTAWLALPLLACLMSWGLDLVHPRGDALLTCLGTAALIVRPSRLLNTRHALAWPLHRVGDMSYSLYLVHWPLIALARHVWLEGVPQTVSLDLLGASFGLGWLSWRFVEQGARQAAPATGSSPELLQLLRRLQPATVLMGLAAGAMAWQLHQPTAAQWASLMQPNHGLSTQCEFGSTFTPLPACRTSDTPRTLVWGDSYAMHLLPALQVSAPEGGLVQATRSLCGPVPGLAHIKPGEGDDGARECLAFSDSVLDELSSMRSVEFVVLAARWQYYFDQAVLDEDGARRVVSDAELAASVAEGIRALRRLGKKVLIVSPPALIGPQADLGACATRRALRLVTVGQTLHTDCSFDQADYLARQARVQALLADIASRSKTSVLSLDALNCRDGLCQTTLSGTPLYRDAGHLSHEGSVLAGRVLRLDEQISQLAR
jgi:peptidoglycan/LPS O-acetylase OafA/YrhL